MRDWDIFCAVIDNFGDAGVCWRLARQLASEYDVNVRLWIDDLVALQRLWSQIDSRRDTQSVAGVTICRWREPFADTGAAAVVIEAFGCRLPPNYVSAMTRRAQPSLWINLEYLSAEAWAADCHGLASPQRDSSLQKYFFFPGFVPNTGGLLRERNLLARRNAFQADANFRREFLARFGVNLTGETVVFSLFAYPSAPIATLLQALVQSPSPVLCLIPEGPLLKIIAASFGAADMAAGDRCTKGALTVLALPFLQQDEYDLLLWSCDINCVRGEDSFVRAQWAGRPLLWHIYPQQDDAHWAKLGAFFDCYKAALNEVEAAALGAAWNAWNGRGDMALAWRNLQPLLPALREASARWAERLNQRPDLAAALVQFCANHV